MARYFLCLLFFSSISSAKSDFDVDYLQKVTGLRDQALTNSLAYDLTESLTTEVGSSLGGSEGDAKAVAWGVAKFKELGFDKVYTEPVTFKKWVRGKETAQVLSPYSHELKITALGGSYGTPKKGLKGELVHFESLEAFKQADIEQIKGKIVFISKKMRRTPSGKGYGEANDSRYYGPELVAQKGGIGLLIRSIGTDSNRDPHTGSMKFKEEDKETGEITYLKEEQLVPAAALSNPDADLLVSMLKRKEAVIVNYTLGSKWHGDYTSQNVIGEITGSEKPDEVILIGGHLDSWDLGTGAIDDASGCAITMATAKLIKDSGINPKRTIRVVLWANEEYGLSGAKAYAKAHEHELDKHIIGAESDFGAGPIYAFSSRISDNSLGFISQMSVLLAPMGIAYAGNNGAGGADISPLIKLGMAAMSLKQDGSKYFDLHHTQDDTMDKIVPEEIAQNVAVWVVFVSLAAEYSGDFGFDLEEKKEK
jgi:hypothetical protein